MDDRRKTEFLPDDLVFAKMKSYPPWPALVIGPDEATSASQNPKTTIQFLGTNEIGYLRMQDLFDYAEFRDKFAIPKKIKGFSDGLKQIAAMYEERVASAGSVEADVIELKRQMADSGPSEDIALIDLFDEPKVEPIVESPSRKKQKQSRKHDSDSKYRLDKECEVWLVKADVEGGPATAKSPASVIIESDDSPALSPAPFPGSAFRQRSYKPAERPKKHVETTSPHSTMVADAVRSPPSTSAAASPSVQPTAKRVPIKKKFDDNFIVDVEGYRKALSGGIGEIKRVGDIKRVGEIKRSGEKKRGRKVKCGRGRPRKDQNGAPSAASPIGPASVATASGDGDFFVDVEATGDGGEIKGGGEIKRGRGRPRKDQGDATPAAETPIEPESDSVLSDVAATALRSPDGIATATEELAELDDGGRDESTVESVEEENEKQDDQEKEDDQEESEQDNESVGMTIPLNRLKIKLVSSLKKKNAKKRKISRTVDALPSKRHRIALSADPLRFIRLKEDVTKLSDEEIDKLPDSRETEPAYDVDKPDSVVTKLEPDQDQQEVMTNKVDQAAALSKRLLNLRKKRNRKKKVFVTALGLFCEMQSELLVTERPDLRDFRAINEVIRERWKLLPEEEKQRFQSLARKERQRRLQAAQGSSGKKPVAVVAPKSSSDESSGESDDSDSSSSTENKKPRPSKKYVKKPAAGAKKIGRPLKWPEDPNAVVLARRKPIAPVEARCRWWMYQSASTTLQQRKSARENSPPRPLHPSDATDSAAVFRIMAKTFQQMAERLEKTNEVNSSASKSVMIDCLMDGFFVSLVQLLNLIKYAPNLNKCFPTDSIGTLLEKTAFLTPL